MKKKFIIFSYLLASICEYLRYSSYEGSLTLPFSTEIGVLLSFAVGGLVYFSSPNGHSPLDTDSRSLRLRNFWVAWLVVEFFRGLLLADGYWAYKFILTTTLPFVLLVYSCLRYATIDAFTSFCSIFVRICILGILLILPAQLIFGGEMTSRILVPISFFLLFVPYLKRSVALILIGTAVTCCLTALEYRTNVLRILAAFSLLLLVVPAMRFISRRSLVFINSLIYFIPIFFVLISLLDVGVIERLTVNGDMEIINSKGESENLLADSRTFIFQEMMRSLTGLSDWLFGKAPGVPYASDWFYDDGGAVGGLRFQSEVGILNTLHQFGLVGVISFFALLFYVTNYAIRRARNKLAITFALLISVKWALSFVEEYFLCDLNNLVFFLAISILLSGRFLSKTESQIRAAFVGSR